MGKGVGIGVGQGARECAALHHALRDKWADWLSDQDRGNWKPHWTVMNKELDEKKVRSAFDSIRRNLFENEHQGSVVGLDLWRYDRGKWVFEKDFMFVGSGRVDSASSTRNNSTTSLHPIHEEGNERTDKGKKSKEKKKKETGIKNYLGAIGFGRDR